MRTELFDAPALSCDDFLGGKVRLLQPREGYRAGVDPVLLSATVPAKSGERVLELGCGAGPGLCCLGARVEGLDLHGLEIQPGYADLARRNLSQNAQTGTIWEGCLSAPPDALRQISFHHVFANPPYFRSEERRSALDAGRELGLAGKTPLESWVQTAAKRLRPGGTATFVQRAERLPELLSAFHAHLGSVELWPLVPRLGRAPRLVLLRGRKAGRAPFRFHAPLVLHAGARHEKDAEDYAGPIAEVLRNGASLPFPA